MNFFIVMEVDINCSKSEVSAKWCLSDRNMLVWDLYSRSYLLFLKSLLSFYFSWKWNRAIAWQLLLSSLGRWKQPFLCPALRYRLLGFNTFYWTEHWTCGTLSSLKFWSERRVGDLASPRFMQASASTREKKAWISTDRNRGPPCVFSQNV